MTLSRESKPRFSTILSWRGKDSRPSGKSSLKFRMRAAVRSRRFPSTKMILTHWLPSLWLLSNRFWIRIETTLPESHYQGNAIVGGPLTPDFRTHCCASILSKWFARIARARWKDFSDEKRWWFRRTFRLLFVLSAYARVLHLTFKYERHEYDGFDHGTTWWYQFLFP